MRAHMSSSSEPAEMSRYLRRETTYAHPQTGTVDPPAAHGRKEVLTAREQAEAAGRAEGRGHRVRGAKRGGGRPKARDLGARQPCQANESAGRYTVTGRR